ncbi:MAG: FAD-binding oxidoreductase [Myxococcales bacterium]|nr:FAD-binding oxidoreductase [Myxococcales bacterium]
MQQGRPNGTDLIGGIASTRIVPGDPPTHGDDCVSLSAWGFEDSRFEARADRSVVMMGDRYAISGSVLPDLLPWMEGVLGVELNPNDVHPPSYPPKVQEPKTDESFLAALRKFLPESSICNDPQVRLRHAHGHSQEDMWAIRYQQPPRLPDLVIQPGCEEDVEAIMDVAIQHRVCLVPFGGGTNVTEALAVPESEQRLLVSVDLSRLNRILWIDPTNMTACIQAGAVGRHVASQLAEYGFIIGHEPDSIEFSTVGGWVATHASGMKKNRYGNIEDLLLDVRIVTPDGVIERDNVCPRESIGIDPRRWILGSEGTLGIVTRVVMKIFPVPEVQHYDAVLFRNFESGVAFLYDLQREAVPPASVRLVDNLQFQLSQTLKPKAEGAKALMRKFERLYVTGLRGFDPDQMVACSFVFEGSKVEVRSQEHAVAKLAKRHRGMHAGAENGRRGYQLTFGIAYLRDFIMRHWVLAESFETSVSWSQALTLCENVKRRVREEYAARGLPGAPFISCRITQLYHSGVCIYFYFAHHYKGLDHPSEIYAELESCARDEVLKSGGSLSHHHGVGKLRLGFLPRVLSPAALRWAAALKQSLDPENVLGAGNLLPPAPASEATDSE